MKPEPSFCLACGRLCKGRRRSYCCDPCAQQGSRSCACGAVLRRQPHERARWFRVRKFCSDDCRNGDISARLQLRWRTPDQRVRLMRGLCAAAATEENVQRARATMKANWQQPQFLQAFSERPRRFTAEQVRAIRADQRSRAVLAQHYEVSGSVIGKIKQRVYYRDVS